MDRRHDSTGLGVGLLARMDGQRVELNRCRHKVPFVFPFACRQIAFLHNSRRMRVSKLLTPLLKSTLEEEPEQLADALSEVHPEDIAAVLSEELPPEQAAMVVRARTEVLVFTTRRES